MTVTQRFPLAPGESEDLSQLAVELLQDLIRIDTSNPPGNEVAAAEYLAGRFRAEGLSPTVLEPSPGRGNVIVRLPAPGTANAIGGGGSAAVCDGQERGRKAGLLLLSHLDVVPAEAGKWDAPPFGGEIRDGYLWGRGTVDTKGLTALQASVLIWAKRKGVPLRKDVILAATANEESGGDWGARWLAENRLDLVDAEAAINEGGGIGLRFAGRLAYLVQTAEKAPCPITITATGTPGHASTPSDDNAVVTISRALVAIGSRRLPVHITDTYRGFVAGLARLMGGPAGAALNGLVNPRLADAAIERFASGTQAGGLRAMIRHTATPTVVQAGYRVNVIPGEVSAQIDCRLLPGFGPDDLLAELKAVLRDADLDGRVNLTAAELSAPSLESPADHPLMAAIGEALGRHPAGGPALPFMVPGATDGRYLRPRGIPVYGFCPMLPGEHFELAHGHNERVSLAGIRFGGEVLWDVVTAYCG